MKVFHNEMFGDGANSVFDFLSGFELLVNDDTGRQTSTICSILQIICKAHLKKSHSAGTFEQNNADLDDL
jgi:hypothetical protein